MHPYCLLSNNKKKKAKLVINLEGTKKGRNRKFTLAFSEDAKLPHALFVTTCSGVTVHLALIRYFKTRTKVDVLHTGNK